LFGFRATKIFLAFETNLQRVKNSTKFDKKEQIKVLGNNKIKKNLILLKALNLYAVENRRLLQTPKIVSCSSGLHSSLKLKAIISTSPQRKASCQLIWHSKYGSHHITIFK
jgi:hypothetical protein